MCVQYSDIPRFLALLRVPIACGNPEGSSVFRHPQPARTFEYIAFEPGKSSVAVRLGGKWTKRDRVLIGFVDQETDLDKARELHPADLGYFFSPCSRSIVGCDGTNFAWRTLVEAWAQQLGEQGCEYAMEKLTNRTDFEYEQGGFLDVFGGSLAMCVKLTEDLEFDVFVHCPHDGYHWVKVGRVSWRGSNLPQGKLWCPVIIFMPRHRMGQPRCAVTAPVRHQWHMKGCGWRRGRPTPTLKLTDRFADTPRLQVLDPTSDQFSDMPTYDSGSGRIVWEKFPRGLCHSLGIDVKQFQVQSADQVLLVEHKSGFQGALETDRSWYGHVMVPAIKLEDELKKRTKHLQHPCAACDGQVMANGPVDHLTSREHWTEVWKKARRSMPSPEVGAQMDLKLPWVQGWGIPGGVLIFNHLTAALKLELSDLVMEFQELPTFHLLRVIFVFD